MKDEIIQQFISMPLEIASTSVESHPLFFNERLEELTEEDARDFINFMEMGSENTIAFLKKDFPPAKKIIEIEDILCKAFIYFFHKGFQTTYFFRIGEEEPDVNINTKELCEGYEDTLLPKYI